MNSGLYEQALALARKVFPDYPDDLLARVANELVEISRGILESRGDEKDRLMRDYLEKYRRVREAVSPVGDPGFDEVLGGGFPKGAIILVQGSAGAGKTVLCSQFLVNGAVRYRERGVYVSLDTTEDGYLREMARFGWDFRSLERDGMFAFIDASPIRMIPGEIKIGKLTVGRQEFSFLGLLDVIKHTAKALNAQRIVIDSLSPLVSRLVDPDRREAVLDLIEALSETNATCLVTLQSERTGEGRTPIEYLAHGVLIMEPEARLDTSKVVGTIRIDKMLPIHASLNSRDYHVTEKGIEVSPSLS
jgi:KaiC/GvpD/RAD55 family RecA-like ATPase